MISNSHRGTKRTIPKDRHVGRTDLSEFDGQRIAVILELDTGRVVLPGTAQFVRDDMVGNSLHIHLDDQQPGQPVIVISEKHWTGRIIPDFHHGCRFSLIIS